MIVGAERGIGRTTAELFAKNGANLVLLDVNPKIDQVFSEIKNHYPDSQGLALQTDIGNYKDCENAARVANEAFGRIDVLAITAGVLQDASLAKDLPIDEWDRIMRINLKGPFIISKAVTPYMIEQRSGSIITISSWWGRSGHGFFSAYCTSKAGLIVFTQSLAAELADYNIRVNTICPGNINTGMHQKALKDEAAKRGITFEELKTIEWGKIPLKKAGDPEDIGEAILFLASERAKYITGASLDVNGGVLFH